VNLYSFLFDSCEVIRIASAKWKALLLFETLVQAAGYGHWAPRNDSPATIFELFHSGEMPLSRFSRSELNFLGERRFEPDLVVPETEKVSRGAEF
jgi:hypothetical protein